MAGADDGTATWCSLVGFAVDAAVVVSLVAGLVLLVLLVVVLAALLRARRPTAAGPAGPSPWSDDDEAGARVVLDLRAVDPDTPSVQRLVQEAASRALGASPSVLIVEVVDRDGVRLGEVRRVPPARREAALPDSLHEPHQRRSSAPDPVRSEREARSGSPVALPVRTSTEEPIDAPGARPFADRYDLPAAVLERLDDHDDPTALVAALLAAAGRPVERHDSVVVSGEVAVTVALVDDGGERSLSRAYLRVKNTGAPYGLIVRIGYADPVSVHQRELAAPEVRHVPASALQRMADGVALGADPLAFATGPPVVR